MKLSRRCSLQQAFWGPFCCLMLLTCSSRTEGRNAFKGVLERNSASFIETLHHYLRTEQILQTDFVYDAFQCGLNCLLDVKCISFNFKLQALFGGKHMCELLASDKFDHSIYLEPRAEFHHYSILVSFRS